jgi:hypothetical protein
MPRLSEVRDGSWIVKANSLDGDTGMEKTREMAGIAMIIESVNQSCYISCHPGMGISLCGGNSPVLPERSLSRMLAALQILSLSSSESSQESVLDTIDVRYWEMPLGRISLAF